MPISKDLAKAYTVAAVEGFSTLAVEVIAIRLAVPVVGSSITLTGVMLGVVLLALSAGYWRGGALSSSWPPERTRLTLARNLLIAAAIYGAIAFPLEAPALEKLLDIGFPLPWAIGTAAVLLFLAPIYFASQTVPMLAEITNIDGHAGRASGKVLFFSTLGSVAGGIVTPVWLFPSLGVSRTTYIVCILLALAGAVMAWRQTRIVSSSVAALVIAVSAVAGHNTDLYRFDSAYQTIRVIEDHSSPRVERVLMMGGGRASGIYTDNRETSFAYALSTIAAIDDLKPSRILVIGAAGFNVPRDAARRPFVRHIDAVDVDPSVRAIAERHFLNESLSPKIAFLPQSARYAVRRMSRAGEQYAFTLVDAFIGQGIPEELVTVEFFSDLRRISTHTAANLILDRDLETEFAHNLLATYREAFGAVWLKDVHPGDSYFANYLVTSWPVAGSSEWKGRGTPYRDDRNTADQDHVALMW